MSYLFVGEKPSRTAYERGVTWETGGLAARTLHDALDAAGIDRKVCQFTNLFGEHPANEEAVKDVSIINRIRAAADEGFTIVGMGKKVQHWLDQYSIQFVPIVHPAARGKIRAKALYQAHVKEALS